MHSRTTALVGGLFLAARGRAGMALVTVMIFMAGLTIIGASLASYVGTHARLTRAQVDREAAFYLAEAALQRAAAHIANGADVPSAFSDQFGAGEYWVTISASRPAPGAIGVEMTINGDITINPNNSIESRFEMILADGTQITRDKLDNTAFVGYQGHATVIRLKPSGNGAQNTLYVDGEPYPVENGNTYQITAEALDVLLYNDKHNSKATGPWHIQIASDAAVIEVIR